MMQRRFVRTTSAGSSRGPRSIVVRAASRRAAPRDGLRALFDAMTELVVATSDDACVYANPAAVRALGYATRDELVGRHASSIWVDTTDTSALAQGAWRQAKLAPKNGPQMSVEIATFPVTLDDSACVAMLARPVADLGTEAHARDRMAALRTLAMGAAHEINNPMTYVLGNIEYVERKLRTHEGAGSESPGGRTLVAALLQATQGIHRMRHIVRTLMTFSQGEIDRRTRLDLRDVLAAATELAAPEICARAELVKELSEVPPIEANEARLGEMLIDLLVNAAYAIPEGQPGQHRVRVACSTTAEGAALIEIEDTGVGILPEHLGRIFEPFFTTRPFGRGAGLGLSFVYGVVSDLGGTIDVKSTPGHGTIFRVTLPSMTSRPRR